MNTSLIELLKQRGDMLVAGPLDSDFEDSLDSDIRLHTGKMLLKLARAAESADPARKASITARCWHGSPTSCNILHAAMGWLNEEVSNLGWRTYARSHRDAASDQQYTAFGIAWEGENPVPSDPLSVFNDDAKAAAYVIEAL